MVRPVILDAAAPIMTSFVMQDVFSILLEQELGIFYRSNAEPQIPYLFIARTVPIVSWHGKWGTNHKDL